MSKPLRAKQPQRLVVEAGLGEDFFQLGDDLLAVGVRLEHGEVAVAGQELDRPVLPGLEARRLAERIAEFRVFAGRHGAQHVPGIVQLLEDAGDARQHLEGRLQLVVADRADRRTDLVDRQLHPQFRGLVLDDEQQFVMRARQRLLRVEHALEMQIVAVGHALLERHLRAFLGGIVGLAAHVTSAFLRYCGWSQRRLVMMSSRISTAPSTSASPR